MLGWIQRNKTKTGGTIIIGLCVIVMLSFGLDQALSPGNMQYAATVDGDEITFLDFERQRQQVEQRHRQTFGEQFETYRRFLNINQEAVDSSINELLLARVINKLDITASLELIEQQIIDSPFFEGGFTPEKFENYKQALRMSGAQIEQLFREDTIRQQFIRFLQDTSYLPELELKATFSNNETKRAFRFVEISPDSFLDKVEITDEALEQYFTENAENYRTPRAVSYSVVEFRADNFLAQVEVQEEDLQYLYDERKSEFTNPPQVRLRWIKIDKKSEALSKLEELVLSEEEKQNEDQADKGKEEAEAILAKIEDGGDFLELAKTYSQDESTAEQGGELGWKRYDQLEPEIARAVRLLENGENSNVITTDSGYYIVKLEEQQAASLKDFAEVKPQLEQEFRAEEAPAYAFAAAEKFYDSVRSGEQPLQEKAQSENLAVIQTQTPVSTNDAAPGVPAGLTQEVINNGVGDIDLVELDGAAFIVEITEEQDSKIPELAEIKDRVSADYKKVLAEAEARKKADELLTQLKDNTEGETTKGLATLEQGSELKVLETDPITRLSGGNSTFPFLAAPDKRAELFKLQQIGELHKEVVAVANKFYLVELSSLELPSDEQFKEKIKEVRDQEEQQRLGRIFNALIATLRAKSTIWVNPTVTEQPSEGGMI